VSEETITIEHAGSAESQHLENIAHEAVETLGEAVETVAELTQEVASQAQESIVNSQEVELEPEAPNPETEVIYSPVDHSHSEYENRIRTLEEVIREMVENAETPELVSEPFTETQTGTQSNASVPEQAPSSTESIIQPPADRSKPEPSGIWSFFRKIGW